MRTCREDCATIPRLNREIKKYLKRKAPSRPGSGPPQLRQTISRSVVGPGGASIRTTSYSAPRVGHLKFGGDISDMNQKIAVRRQKTTVKREGSGLNPRHSSIRFSRGNEDADLCAATFVSSGLWHALIHRPRRASKARGRQDSDGLSSSRSSCGLYGLQTLMKAWHHMPFWQVIFPGPQAHDAAAGRSVSHGERSFCMCICPLA